MTDREIETERWHAHSEDEADQERAKRGRERGLRPGPTGKERRAAKLETNSFSLSLSYLEARYIGFDVASHDRDVQHIVVLRGSKQLAKASHLEGGERDRGGAEISSVR
jgi:hypothetical protein